MVVKNENKMKELDVKSIIALQSINNQFLSLVDSIKTDKNIKLQDILNQLYKPYEKIEKNYRTNHHFFNQYHLISSLYTYIVLPKENFFDSISDEIESSKLKSAWGLNNLPNSYKLKYFLRRIRNAVSHGNIEFTEALKFTFTDINYRNKDDIFQVELSSEELLKFTQALSYWCLTKDLELENL